VAITVTPGQALTPQEWEALFGQHRGGGSVVNISAKKALKDQILTGEDLRPIYRYYANDGSYVEARTHTNGEDYEVVDYKPSKEFTEAAPAALSPAQQNDAALNEQRRRNAALPLEQDPRYETDEDRATRAAATIKQQGADARQAAIDQAAADKAKAATQPASATATVPGYPGWTATTTKTPATPTSPEREVTTYTGPDGKAQPSLPAKPDAPTAPDIKVVTGSDGKPYTITTTLGAGNVPRVVTADSAGTPVAVIPGQAKQEPISSRYNPETGEYEQITRDAQGNPVIRPIPREGALAAGAKTPAPSLPQIVVGQSQDALRTAYDQIQQEVDSGRRTAAWGENRRKEVYDAAHLAVSEAQIIEQSRQANQTTSFNVSNTVLNYGQSALENALKFTLQINDKLKPGSGSGGRMFAALFNMQMKMAKDSGIYDLGVPRGSSVGAGGPSSASGQSGAQTAQAPPKPRLTNPGDPAAVEADHQASRAQLEALEAAGGPRAYTPAMGGPQQSLPIRNGVPVTSTPALPATAAPAPPPGGPVVPPVPLPQPAAAPGAPPPAPMPAITPPPAFSDPGFYRPDMQGTDTTDPGFYRPDMQGTDTTDPGFHRPLPGAQPQGSTALDALRAQFAPPPVQPLDPMGGMDPTTGGIPRLASSLGTLPPALQRAQIASMPPWRLPPQDLDALVEQHGPEAVFGWPGQHLLGGV
jgi:hypothetical protein